MSPGDYLQHERHRFSYMTRAQLEVRLSKMTHMGKLQAFMQVAAEQGLNYLIPLAQNRIDYLQNRRVFREHIVRASRSAVILNLSNEVKPKKRPVDLAEIDSNNSNKPKIRIIRE